MLYEKPVMNMKKTVIITFQHTYIPIQQNLYLYTYIAKTCDEYEKNCDFYFLTKPVLNG